MADCSSEVQLRRSEDFSFVLSILRNAGLLQSETALLQEIYERGLGPVLVPDLDPEAFDPTTEPGSRHATSSDQPAPSANDLQQPNRTERDGGPRPKPPGKVPPNHHSIVAPVSLAAATPWGKGVEEYDNMEDVGYRRKRVTCTEQFVAHELELNNSEEGSEPYSQHGASPKASATPAAVGAGSKQPQQQQHRSVSASDEEDYLPAAAPARNERPGGSGAGHNGDEVWDQGPRDIKIADPVTTPQKSPSQRSTDEARPVLSRVESLSSSFKDFELERLDDDRCLSRGSQPSEPDHAFEDGIRFNLPASDLDLFANASKAAALSTALFKLQSHNSQAAGSEAGAAKAQSEPGAQQQPSEAKETIGGFSFPVTPNPEVSLDPKPLTPWPIRSNSTSERWLEGTAFFASSEGLASRSKLGRGTADDVHGPKPQQRTASDSGIVCSPSGKDSAQPHPAPLSNVSTAEADGSAPSEEADAAACAGDDAQQRSGGAYTEGKALPRVEGPSSQDVIASAPAVSCSAGDAGIAVTCQPSADAEDSASDVPSPSLEEPPDLRLGREDRGSGSSTEGVELEQELESGAEGRFIQPPPVDWMADVEGEGQEEEELEEEAEAAAEAAAEAEAQLPKYSVDENGAILYHYDPQYIQRKYEVFPLQIIHRRHRTGFEETKDFPIRMNDLIAGRYQVLDFLGSAAFSRAVQALDIKTNTLVCLKIVKNNKDYFDQSLDEIKLLKYVNSNDPRDEHGVVRLFDYFYYKEHLFLVCELLRANLYEFQKYNKESGEELYFTNARIQKIAVAVLRSLAFLHSLDLIHSDLKPENILIKSYSRCEVKVIDLGSSCFVTDQLSAYVQSRSYRAPEVILGLPYDHKVDIWSLGCILAELSSGYVLFQNDSVATLLARLEGILGRTPTWMIQKGRYANMFYTRSHQLYERTQTAQAQPSAPSSPTPSAAPPTPPSAPTPDCYELLVPKRTCLQHRLPAADAGLLSFVSFLLNVDPLKRPSAVEALRHPWLHQRYRSLDSMS